MGIAKAPPVSSSSKKTNPYPAQKPNSDTEYHSMSGQQQEYQENIYATFSNGFHRSMALAQHDPIRRENNNNKMRGFEPTPPPTLVAPPTQHPSTATSLHPVYETAGMLSEMFNYGPGPGPGHAQSADVLDYRRAVGGLGSDWYGGSRQLVRRDSIGDQHQPQQSDTHHLHHMPSINADSAAAMQLFLTNPPPRSPSPPPPPASGSTLHMLLPSPSGGSEFHSIGAPNPNFWSSAAHINNPVELGGIVEGQGLSLSLSSSLQHLEAAKQAEELRNIGTGDSHNIMFFNQPSSSTSTSTPGTHFLNNLQQQQSILVHNLQGTSTAFGIGPGSSQGQVQIGFGSGSTSSSLGVENLLRNSKYAKPAQELLEEFCSVGRGHLKKSKLARQNSVNPNLTTSGGGSSTWKDPAQLSAGDRAEHQRRKVKLLSMLDEVDRRYNNYCEQMQMVVNSFDMVMGYGGAIPYTGLAQKAMSRHFRCLKEAIQAEVRRSCEVLGEKDPTGSAGLTKGETPRLKMLEQSLRQQRAFNQMGMGIGMMEQEAWRPQRGLPERSVNILRAWLFEHFLHPYPSDADKHMLARQTGLSRNQVSNWFINARVRLWKPMVEEMYQQESKELADDDDDDHDNDNDHEIERHQTSSTTTNSFATTSHQAQNPMPSSSAAAVASATVSASASTMTPVPPDSDPSLLAINRPHHQPPPQHATTATAVSQAFLHGTTPADNVGTTTMIQFGTASGDVSLTLGLRHAGNAPEKSAAFSIRDFRSC